MRAFVRPNYKYIVERIGELAHRVERLLCKQEASGSRPLFSTNIERAVVSIKSGLVHSFENNYALVAQLVGGNRFRIYTVSVRIRPGVPFLNIMSTIFPLNTSEEVLNGNMCSLWQ